MCAQLDLEVMCKSPSKIGITSNFHEFWSEEVQCIEYPKIKN
jgi:hypothetical protein